MTTFRRGVITVLCAATGLAAATAGGALAAAEAVGAPTLFECRKLARTEGRYGGTYLDPLCSEAATPLQREAGTSNRYELQAGAGRGIRFSGVGGPAVLHAKTSLGDMTAECASSRESGRMAAPNLELGVTVVWSNCKALGSYVCSSPGATPGKIRTVPLHGQLGYLEEAGQVGVKLESEAVPGGLVAEFRCGVRGFFEGKVHGELIGSQQGDIGAITEESTIVDEAIERLGEQEFQGHRYRPLINLLGWAGEVPAIEAGERPAEILTGEFCGEFIRAIIAKTCTPPTPLGLDEVTSIKGEPLGVFAG